MTEEQLQRAIVSAAEAAAWRVFFLPDWLYRLAMASLKRSRRNDRHWARSGFPDLVLCRPPRLIFAECKSHRGAVRDTQASWLTALRNCGVEVYVWRPEHLDDVIAMLGGAPVTFSKQEERT